MPVDSQSAQEVVEPVQVLSEAGSDAPTPEPSSLGRLLFSGSSTLGIASLIERGLGFVANLAAARLGGAHTFGAYSVAMSTANNVASYAGAGIGTTANRFSGEYRYGQAGYGALLRALSVVSLGSAALAAAGLWIAAKPLATHLLRNPGLTSLLRLAALSAGVVILLECLRGLLIGQRRFAALLALCALYGGGMLALLPMASKHGAWTMVMVQAGVASAAILTCVIAARRLGFAPPSSAPSGAGPRPGIILRFGMVQLAGTIGINAAGWWVASLVARGDISLIQAGCYSVATQLRNMCAMPSWLISQTAYAQLTESSGRDYGGPGRVTLVSTIAATMVSLLIAGPAVALMPWMIRYLYGKDFAGAELAATLLVATGLLHMSAAPAAARLTVVSLPLTGIINGVWAAVVVVLGTWWIPTGGAAEAAASFLAAHIFAAIAVLISLIYLGAAPRALTAISMPALAASVLFAGLGWLRSTSSHKPAISFGILAATAALVWYSYHHARTHCAGVRTLTPSRLMTVLFSGLPRSLRTRKLRQD
jgi:O-antigen/teichoic acid export membrane protein